VFEGSFDGNPHRGMIVSSRPAPGSVPGDILERQYLDRQAADVFLALQVRAVGDEDVAAALPDRRGLIQAVQLAGKDPRPGGLDLSSFSSCRSLPT
jgi:hypothetical protein